MFQNKYSYTTPIRPPLNPFDNQRVHAWAPRLRITDLFSLCLITCIEIKCIIVTVIPLVDPE